MPIEKKKKGTRIVAYRARPYAADHYLKSMGKTFKVTEYGSSSAAEKAARQYCADIEKKYKADDEIIDKSSGKKITLRQALSEYWHEAGQHMLGADSIKNRIERLKAHKIGSMSLSGLKPSDILKLQNELLETKAPSTVINDMSPISASIKHARIKHDMYYLNNPCDEVKSPSTAGNQRDRVLSWSEKKALLRACDASGNAYLGEIVRLALELGLRQSRLVNLRWSQVDLEKKIIRYTRSEVAKASSNKRVPPFAPLTRRAEKVFIRMHERTGHSDRVFQTTQNAVRLAFQKAKVAAGLHVSGTSDNFRFHDTRHEAISTMMNEGFSDIQIMLFVGIKSAQTLKRYSQLNESEMVSERQSARQKRVAKAKLRKGKADHAQVQQSSKARLVSLCQIYGCSFNESGNQIELTAPAGHKFKLNNQQKVEMNIESWMSETAFGELCKLVESGVS